MAAGEIQENHIRLPPQAITRHDFSKTAVVRLQSLIFVLCATGFASVSPTGVATWEALAEPVAPLTIH
jgi:hypothetical protein